MEPARPEGGQFIRVREWEKHYEKSRTRAVKKMEWVAVSNRQDGYAFRLLLSHPNGLAHYGVWVLLLGIASRCEPRGRLARANGMPHTPATLAIMSGHPTANAIALFEEAMERLLSPDIGWLEWEPCADAQPSGATAPESGADAQPSGAAETIQDRTGQDRTGHNKKDRAAENAADFSPDWLNLVEAPPKRRGRPPKQAGPGKPKPPKPWEWPSVVEHFPESHRSQRMQAAWMAWATARREANKSVTPTVAKRTAAKLSGYDADTAALALEVAADNGWAGVFPESVVANGRAKKEDSKALDRADWTYDDGLDSVIGGGM